jgi:hypothetical protein
LNQQEIDAQKTENESEMKELAEKGTNRVKILLTFNLKLPTKILEKISRDENKEVRRAAEDALKRRGQEIKA